MGITPSQFDQMNARLARPSRRPEPAVGATCSEVGPGRPAVAGSTILGIDPSLRGTGWGVVRFERSKPRALGFGTIRCPATWSRSQCLVRIAASLREAIQAHRPEICAIEALFFAQNLQTALLMGEARGVCLLSAAEAGLAIYEMAPRRMKRAIVGFGGAQKSAVARMVQRQLGLEELPAADAADALALALAHAQDSGRDSITPRRRL